MNVPSKDEREQLAKIWETVSGRGDADAEEYIPWDGDLPESLFAFGLLVTESLHDSITVTSLGVAYLKLTDRPPANYTRMSKEQQGALILLHRGWKSQEWIRDDIRGFLAYDGGEYPREVYEGLVSMLLAEKKVDSITGTSFRITETGRSIVKALEEFHAKFPGEIKPTLADIKDAMKKHERAWDRCKVYHSMIDAVEINAAVRTADDFNRRVEKSVARLRRWAEKDKPVHPALLDDLADELEGTL